MDMKIKIISTFFCFLAIFIFGISGVACNKNEQNGSDSPNKIESETENKPNISLDENELPWVSFD